MAVDLDNLKDFVDSLTVEDGYPCLHRRIKKYVTEVDIDNFVRSVLHILKQLMNQVGILILQLVMVDEGYMRSTVHGSETRGSFNTQHS